MSAVCSIHLLLMICRLGMMLIMHLSNVNKSFFSPKITCLLLKAINSPLEGCFQKSFQSQSNFSLHALKFVLGRSCCCMLIFILDVTWAISSSTRWWRGNLSFSCWCEHARKDTGGLWSFVGSCTRCSMGVTRCRRWGGSSCWGAR